MDKKGGKAALVLGIGNVLMRDEGAGIRALELFISLYQPHPQVECVDGGTAGLALIDLFKAYKYVIIIDAVNAAKPAGSVLKINRNDVMTGTLRTTAHGIGVNDLVELARLEGFCPEISVIGIVPEDVSPGLELTPAVMKKLGSAADAVRDELRRVGIKVRINARVTKGKKDA